MLTQLRFRRAVNARHARTARRLSHLHRLFQASLGILLVQHPAVVAACGAPVRWAPLSRPGGGVGLYGSRASWSLVPTLEGTWSPAGAPSEVVRAADETLDAMFRTAEEALASARPGRDGNQAARGWFYMQRGLTETQFVRQYVELVRAPRPPEPLTDLFGPGLRG